MADVAEDFTTGRTAAGGQARRALAVALAISDGTPLAPQAYERLLLDQFVRGELTLDQVLYRMDVHQQYNPFVS